MRRLFGLVIAFALCLSLSACSGSDADDTAYTEAPVATEDVEAAPKLETITIFTIDTTSMSIVPSQVKKNEDDNSLTYITELVLDSLDDDDIKINEAMMEDDTAIISFDSSGKPITGCDEEMEYLILDCLSSSILDNVEGCHNVIFRSDKKAYKSENLTMEEDEVYASN